VEIHAGYVDSSNPMADGTEHGFQSGVEQGCSSDRSEGAGGKVMNYVVRTKLQLQWAGTAFSHLYACEDGFFRASKADHRFKFDTKQEAQDLIDDFYGRPDWDGETKYEVVRSRGRKRGSRK
jgi:hypothetical protein